MPEFKPKTVDAVSIRYSDVFHNIYLYGIWSGCSNERVCDGEIM